MKTLLTISGDVCSILAGRKEPRGGVQRRRGDRRERGAAGQLHDQNHQTQKGEVLVGECLPFDPQKLVALSGRATNGRPTF